METLNRVQLIGQIAPTPRYGDTLGQSAAFHADWEWNLSFSVATKHVLQPTSKQEISDPCWHRIIARGVLAKHCFEVLKPGAYVFEGQIVHRKYDDGSWSTDIEAERVELLNS